MDKIEDIKTNNKHKKHLKKWVRVCNKIFSIIIFLIVFGIIFLNYLLSPVSTSNKIVNFTIEEGSTVDYVGKSLEEKGIIKSYLGYKIYVRLNHINTYKSGIYRLDKSYDTKKIVELLTGDLYKKSGITITFKEGKNIRNIAKTISKYTNITESEFYSKLEDENYIDTLINKYWFLTDEIKNKDIYYPLEGYLFPETYTFSNNVKVEDIITQMLNESDKIFSKYKSLIDSSSYNINQIVTLSSIIESEGIYVSDRKMIAGVFYNRLNSGMSLGSDITTYYAFKVDLGKRDLTSAEINTYNPYNTRGPKMNGKLPIGAVSNFGETSLLATLKPTTNNYYYFVADKSGKTHFTKTYEEHQKLISELKAANNWIEW